MMTILIRRIMFATALLMAASLGAWAHEAHKPASSGQPQTPMAMPSLEEPAVQPPRPAKSEITVILSHLKQPEYIHVIINPMPLVGMALGAALLLAGLWLGSDGMKEAGLALAVLAGIITFPTVKFGQHAYDRLYDIRKIEPGYMAMGETGMEEHAGHARHMEGPENTLPMMGGDGPFGSIGMGDMFTMLKVHDDMPRFESQEQYSKRVKLSEDMGWYRNPAGTVAESVTGKRPADAEKAMKGKDHSGMKKE